jgi:uncharacterized membrane protein
MPKPKVDSDRKSAASSARAGKAARPAPDFVAAAATIGVIAAGAALFEVALIPGIVLGGAAVLAPKYLPKYLPGLKRRLQPMLNAAVRRQSEPAAARPGVKASLAAPAGFSVKQAVAKTITFRIIVTTLDFTSNYVVIGEAGTSAGLSAFALVVGPLFYFAHEAAWNYFGPSAEGDVSVAGFTISRALAKTITFRTIATAMAFTTLYVVVGDLPTAIGLSAFGFVVGPFVYLGHEIAWDYYGSPRKGAPGLLKPIKLIPPPTKLAPAAG